MAIMAAAAAAGMSPSLFSSPPPNPRINDPRPSQNAPPPLPVPKPRRNPNPQNPSHNAPNRTLKQPIHTRTNYYKPLPKSPGAVVSADGDRSVVVGESGISYLLPNAPFEFQFSYSETPKAPPLAIREPAFLPFAPPSMARPWTGKAPLMSKKEKERKKKIRLFEPLGRDDEDDGEKKGLLRRVAGRKVDDLARFCAGDGRSREEILGEPLTRREVRELIKPWLSKNRQVNLGRDGLTHNMLEMIHAHWKRQEVCKVRCRGVPTVDMDNVCYHLEEKTGGKIIHRVGGVVYLFRGRNYNPRTRPRYPIMLWKPSAPVYPKLIQDAPEGLSKEEADEFRRKGKNLLPICKLAKNGIYLNLVKDVRDAFDGSPLVKIDCQGLHASDYKKIGAKLMELVPCVLLSFDEEQILMWGGNNRRPRYLAPISSLSKINKINDSGASSDVKDTDSSDGISGKCMPKQEVIRSKMFLLWKRALDSHKALLLDDNTELSPDSLLEKVEESQSMSQASEHSYPALIMSSAEGVNNAGRSLGSSDRDNEDEFVNTGRSVEDVEDYDIDISDSLEVDPLVPYGSIPVDSVAKRLSSE